MDKKDEKNKTLSDVKQALKAIEVKATERKAKRDAERAVSNEARRKRMNSKPMSKGSSIQGLQGLQTRFGSKITK